MAPNRDQKAVTVVLTVECYRSPQTSLEAMALTGFEQSCRSKDDINRNTEPLKITELFQLMNLFSKWFIWQLGILPKSGRCQSETGNLLSIASLLSLEIAFLNRFSPLTQSI
jgi:hypothetical protein